jgi:hypothetical protein
VLDKPHPAEVEFAPLGSVLAAVGEAEEDAAITRRQHARAVEHPVAPLGGGQRIDIEQILPIRRGGRERCQTRRSPQSPDVHIVLPEIGEAVAKKARIGNAVGRGDDRQGLAVHLGIARIAFEHREAAPILLAHPGESRRPFNLL